MSTVNTILSYCYIDVNIYFVYIYVYIFKPLFNPKHSKIKEEKLVFKYALSILPEKDKIIFSLTHPLCPLLLNKLGLSWSKRRGSEACTEICKHFANEAGLSSEYPL